MCTQTPSQAPVPAFRIKGSQPGTEKLTCCLEQGCQFCPLLMPLLLKLLFPLFFTQSPIASWVQGWREAKKQVCQGWEEREQGCPIKSLEVSMETYIFLEVICLLHGGAHLGSTHRNC